MIVHLDRDENCQAICLKEKACQFARQYLEYMCLKFHICVTNYQMKTTDTYMKGCYVNIVDVIVRDKDLKKVPILETQNGY